MQAKDGNVIGDKLDLRLCGDDSVAMIQTEVITQLTSTKMNSTIYPKKEDELNN